MTSALSGIPIARRRRVAATLGLFATLFTAVGAVSLTGLGAVVHAFAAVALLVAVLLALMAWGVLHSVRQDVAEQQLDAALEAVVAAHPELGCGCGHDHDPDELHVTDADAPEASAQCTGTAGGAGTDCAHDCASCVLAGMRPSPTRTRAERLGG